MVGFFYTHTEMRHFVPIVAAAGFLHAAAVRLLSENERRAEEDTFGLPPGGGYVTAVFELFLAAALLTRAEFAVPLTIAFLSGATLAILLRKPCEIAKTWKDLATYQSTASSVALHGMYVALLILYVCTKPRR